MSLKHAILVLLETEPSSGYDLLKHFKNSLGYFWNAKHQQIYLQLKQLSDEALIRHEVHPQDAKPDKKTYQITSKGTEELKRWLTSPVKPNKVNDALLVKIYGGHLISEEEVIKELNDHTIIHQRTLDALLAMETQLKKLSPEKQSQYKLPYITLRRGILGEQAWLEWANEAKAMIKK